jgi:hypothetical protein
MSQQKNPAHSLNQHIRHIQITYFPVLPSSLDLSAMFDVLDLAQ